MAAVDDRDSTEAEAERASQIMMHANMLERAKLRRRYGGSLWWTEGMALTWIVTRDMPLVGEAFVGKWTGPDLKLALRIAKINRTRFPRIGSPSPDLWPFDDVATAGAIFQSEQRAGRVQARRGRTGPRALYSALQVIDLWQPIPVVESLPKPSPEDSVGAKRRGRPPKFDLTLLNGWIDDLLEEYGEPDPSVDASWNQAALEAKVAERAGRHYGEKHAPVESTIRRYVANRLAHRKSKAD